MFWKLFTNNNIFLLLLLLYSSVCVHACECGTHYLIRFLLLSRSQASSVVPTTHTTWGVSRTVRLCCVLLRSHATCTIGSSRTIQCGIYGDRKWADPIPCWEEDRLMQGWGLHPSTTSGVCQSMRNWTTTPQYMHRHKMCVTISVKCKLHCLCTAVCTDLAKSKLALNVPLYTIWSACVNWFSVPQIRLPLQTVILGILLYYTFRTCTLLSISKCLTHALWDLHIS